MKWDSQEWREERNKRLLAWAGDEDAVRCMLTLSAISETWDDLVDGDRQLTGKEINEAFVNALVRLQLNPFYQLHHAMIMPVAFVGINAWLDANDLERSEEVDQRALSFYIRNYCYEVCSICVMCAKGFDELRRVSLEMRLFFTHESYFSWENRL